MLKLVKTIGGHSGSPKRCSCGSIDFFCSGKAWYCAKCSIYFPTDIQSGTAYDSLRKNLNDLNKLHGELKFMLTELEQIVKE